MTNSGETSQSFSSYLKSLLKITLSSSLALGLLACILIFIVGETSMNFEVGLDIEAIDGLWVFIGLPVIAVIAFVVISPLSFVIHRILSKREIRNQTKDV